MQRRAPYEAKQGLTARMRRAGWLRPDRVDLSHGRRRFLLGWTALALASFARGANEQAPRVLRAAPARVPIAGSGYPDTEVWAYDGTVPGPVLRLRQGERLRVTLENFLPQDTTVHWHGVRLPNAMDGVPHLTQPPVAAGGGRFAYEFDLPDAGTYWYHPHLASSEQLGRGLYGALVVEEREPPEADRDLVWVLSDWRLDRQARIVEDFGSFMDASHAGRIGNTVTVNGRVAESFDVRAGERLRLRLVNAANARIFGLRFEGHAPWVIALDGHPVEPHRPDDGRIVLGPGMRADLILDCTGEPGSSHRVVDDFYPRRAYRLLDLRYANAGARAPARPAPRELAPNPLAEPDLVRAERHIIAFAGGMMGGLTRELAARGIAWTVNGKAIRGHDHEPFLTLARGSSQVLELVNETAWHHPIHLHGHAFRVLSRDGRPNPRREWADTVLLFPRSRAEIALVADNPGLWMLHCHVLEHQESGLAAVFRVA